MPQPINQSSQTTYGQQSVKFYNCTVLLQLIHTANITPNNKNDSKTLGYIYLLIGDKTHAFPGHLMTALALLRALHQSLSR